MQKKNSLLKLVRSTSQYIVMLITVTVGIVFFKLLNHTKVIGKKNVPQNPNTLLLSNHQSMIDSLPIGLFAFFPTLLCRPSMIPWHAAAEENFYRTRILTWLADNWKCIPIKKGRKDVGSIYKMAGALRKGPLILFPEGTRSRDGSIGKARGGAGMVILETHPTVIPVCIEGMDRLLPIGSVFPRPFKRIYICYGKPLDFSGFYESQKTKRVTQVIGDQVIESIRTLRLEITRKK